MRNPEIIKNEDLNKTVDFLVSKIKESLKGMKAIYVKPVYFMNTSSNPKLTAILITSEPI